MNDPNGLIKSNGLRQPMDSMNQWKSPTNGLRPPIESNSHWKSPLDDVHHQQQQNSQTGHFLSYSHHLRDLNADGLNNNNSSGNLFHFMLYFYVSLRSGLDAECRVQSAAGFLKLKTILISRFIH